VISGPFSDRPNEPSGNNVPAPVNTARLARNPTRGRRYGRKANIDTSSAVHATSGALVCWVNPTSARSSAANQDFSRSVQRSTVARLIDPAATATRNTPKPTNPAATSAASTTPRTSFWNNAVQAASTTAPAMPRRHANSAPPLASSTS
jgi:hypothetical protein